LLLKLSVASDRSLVNYIIQQNFDGDWTLPIPRVISTYRITDSNREEMAAIEVLRARRLDQPLSLEAFDPRRFYAANHTSELILSNKTVLLVGTNGSLAEVGKDRTRSQISGTLRDWLRPLMAVLAVATFCVTFWALTMIKKQRQKTPIY